MESTESENVVICLVNCGITFENKVPLKHFFACRFVQSCMPHSSHLSASAAATVSTNAEDCGRDA